MQPDAGLVIHRLATTASTQAAARLLLEQGVARVGHAVVADQQTAGRGRQGREWLSPLGGLYATFIVPHDDLLSVRAGVAAAAALEEFGVRVQLKWPNDLLVGKRKLGGILVETDATVARVGVGINLTACPVDGAASLADLGIRASRGAIIRAVYRELVANRQDPDIVDRYRAVCATLGRSVRIDIGAGHTIEGRAAAIDALGRLVVKSGQGVHVMACGDCLHVDVVAD
jgi:BirA family biotin operon repressor/biotin-[acetyl-CoA-carboxylase] ligase